MLYFSHHMQFSAFQIISQMTRKWARLGEAMFKGSPFQRLGYQALLYLADELAYTSAVTLASFSVQSVWPRGFLFVKLSHGWSSLTLSAGSWRL